MLSKLWRNGVMTSAIEFYCLPCECHVRSIQDAELHIAKPVHKKALEATPYAEGHEGDRILKVPNGYYCEFCNLLFSTTSKVGLHVVDPNHVNTKGQQLLRRDGNTILAYENIGITEKAWNGIRGNTCVVCSKDFVFENIHKSEKEHIIRLIQSKIEFGEGSSIYRKVDGYIQCLTCNQEFLQETQPSHFNSSEHKTKLDESKITINNNILDENENMTDKKIEPVSVDSNKNTETSKETMKKAAEKPKAVPKKDVEMSKDKKDPKNNSADKTCESEDPYVVDKRFREALNADEYISDLGPPFCIICEIDVKEGKDLHLASTHHLRLVKMHKKRLATMKANATAVKDSSDNNNSEQVEQDSNEEKLERNNIDLNNNKDKILESINELTKQGLNVNFESLMVTCKTCKTDLEFDYDFIVKHIEDHKNVKQEKFDLNQYKDEAKNTNLFSEPVTMKKDEASASVDNDSELVDYASKHGLELKDTVYYCGLCGVNLTASLKQLKGHVTGKGHKNRSRRLSQNDTPERSLAVLGRKVPMIEFIDQFHQVKNLAFYDIIINLKFCINVLSFFMFTRHGNRLRCQVCRVNLFMNDVDIHKMEHEHREKMSSTLVVTSIPDEFIREVQPAVLHCGYCNLAVSETDINNHLCSTAHKEVKRAMMARLHQYLPQIQNQRRQAAGMEALFINMLIRSGMFPFDN